MAAVSLQGLVLLPLGKGHGGAPCSSSIVWCSRGYEEPTARDRKHTGGSPFSRSHQRKLLAGYHVGAVFQRKSRWKKTKEWKSLPAIIAGQEFPSKRCECHDLSRKLVPYVDAWQWQKATVEARIAALDDGRPSSDSVILLQHPPVYTLGTRSTLDNLLFDSDHPPAELYRTERGGEVTYHGPGQLVMYPILDLRQQRMDLHWYLRSLEEVVIRALKASCGITGERVDGMTGVWAGGHKLAAIGVRVSRWITYHGLALNVTTDLAAFKKIVPCGIHLPVGSVAELLREPAFAAATSSQMALSSHAGSGMQEGEELKRSEAFYGSEVGNSRLQDDALLELLSGHLLLAFSEIFNCELVPPSKVGPDGVGVPLSEGLPQSPS